MNMTSQSGDTPRADPTGRYLVTGAYGCIGAWVVRHLVRDGARVVTYDLGEDPRRLRLLLDADELAGVEQVQGDITDGARLGAVVDDFDVTTVVHLAALQVPFCRADPALGAQVNVTGTINVLEVVRARADRMTPLVYASSVAVYDAAREGGAPAARLDAFPATLYGVYKRANEGAASVYWHDYGVASIGLRPHTVYGVGRDQGLTSAPTVAMLAAAAGVSYRIPFDGPAQYQLASDAARAFIAATAARPAGAEVYDLPGHVIDVTEIVEAIEAAAPEAAGSIEHADEPLPFPATLDGAAYTRAVAHLELTPFRDGVRQTVEAFRALLADGLVTAEPPARP